MDKDLLFVPRLPEDDVEIPGVGTVRVRALSRIEAIQMQAAKGIEAQERLMLTLGMVDPALTEAEAGRWMRASRAGELNPVTVRIAELSGIRPESAKEAVKSVPGRLDAALRVLPGAEAGHDGGPDASGDVV